ncbi:unnamed protein product [Calicophoron daubneyi]|uniref:Nuclear pore complex protein Nup205 n=1 Tax=Calicophoron daubneyi TaxID=300641 RepID=A0AAV2TPS2_CALDB
MWSVSKSVHNLVVDVLCNGRENRILELETTLEQHKGLFSTLLRPKPRVAAHRDAVKKAVKESISLPGVHQRISLTQDFVDETLLLSDLFETDELVIAELLLTAESQLPSHIHLSRGLLAVILYYDSYQAVLDSLRILIQARDGRTWSPSLSYEVSQFVQRFTVDLWNSGLLSNLLWSVFNFDTVKEFSRLESAHALGNAKHRHDVYTLLNNLENGMAECLLLWSCQSAFALSEFKLVLDGLLRPNLGKGKCGDDVHSSIQEQSSLELTHARTHLLMSLLYSLEPFSLFTPPVEQLSELASVDQEHPLFSDRSFASGIRQSLDDERERLDKQDNEDVSDSMGILALLRLAWALGLRRSAPFRAEIYRNSQGQSTRSPTGSPVQSQFLSEEIREGDDQDFGLDEDDEGQATIGIELGALEFIRKRLLQAPGFEREPLWFCRVHGLVTDLIVNMPVRVKEIRLRDEDLLRRTGFDPSSSGAGFANLLLLIGELYDHLGSQLHARLALEFWWPAGELGGSGANKVNPAEVSLSTGLVGRSPSKNGVRSARMRTTEAENIRQASLFRFIRSAGDTVVMPCLFIPYLRMLHGLVCSRSAAGLCFSLLKANATNPGRATSLITWDHFFASFRQYLNHMKQPVSQQGSSYPSSQLITQLYPHLYKTGTQQSASSNANWMHRATGPTPIYRGGSSAMSVTSVGSVQSGVSTQRVIQPEEEAGLRSVLRLVARIARMDPVARSLFVSTTSWQLIQTCLGLLTCPISIDLKADLIHLMSALSQSPPIAVLIWQQLVSSELLPVVRVNYTACPQPTCGLHTEMDEVEPRAEKYPITRAFLTLVTVLAPQLSVNNTGGQLMRIADGREKTNYPNEENLPSQTEFIVSLTTFLINTIFLKHPMRAYRDINERWDIAASCLVLFDGLVDQFLRRLDAASAVIVKSSQSLSKSADQTHSAVIGPLVTDRFDHIQHTSDWASSLLNAMQEVNDNSQTQAGLFRPPSSAATLIAQLQLPLGWPYSDPGFQLTTRLLADSSLFRTVTGLLEVGLHRLLEFPIPDGPPPGMTRATAAGLRLVRRMLASEDILVTFVRRTAVIPVPGVQPSGGPPPLILSLSNTPSNPLPVAISRLLMSVNSRTGRADLLPMLLRYCSLASELPDHCSYAMDILAYLVNRIKPHSSFLSLLVADQDTRLELLNTFASLLKWSADYGCGDGQRNVEGSTGGEGTNNENPSVFSDEWLFDNSDLDCGQLIFLGMSSSQVPHPAAKAANLFAALPSQPADWVFPTHDWEFLASWPRAHASVLAPFCNAVMPTSCLGSSGEYNNAIIANWLSNTILCQRSTSPCTKLLHILLSALDQPAPNLSHWLLGFQVDDRQSVNRTNLQDAGIADQPRTCLHAILDLIDVALRLGPSSSTLPASLVLSLRWNLSLCWQILYCLSSNLLTSQPILRFLRSNHDLLAKHIQFGLYHPLTQINNVDDDFANRNVFEFLVLNQTSWLLRMLAVEIRAAAAGNQRSYVFRLFKLFLGELLVEGSSADSDSVTEGASLVTTFLRRVKLSEILPSPESFDLRTIDPGPIDELITECEVGCPLLFADSNAVRKVSTIIDPMTFLNRLYVRLLGSRKCAQFTPDDLAGLFTLAYEEQSNLSLPQWANTDNANITLLAQDIVKTNQWIEKRNMYRLRLYAGKHAAMESWREVLEISLGLLANGYCTSIPQSLYSTDANLSSLYSIAARGSIPSVGRSRSLQLVCLNVLSQMLGELCASDTASSTLRLLISGTCLNLCSFLQCSDSFGPSSTSADRESETAHNLLDLKLSASTLVSVVGLVANSILQTKSSAQRMRANFYGSLCFLLRFAQSLTIQLSKDDHESGTILVKPECISAIASASRAVASHWSQTEFEKNADVSDMTSMYCLLNWDLLRGHPVTRMAAMSLFELLIWCNRSAGDLVYFLRKQGTVQHLVESIPEDLTAVESFMMSLAQPTGDDGQLISDFAADSSAATTSFHIYRSKMSLLCRAAATPSGAKLLAQCDVLNSLANCGIFSSSTFANCYAYGLDSLYACGEGILNQQSSARVQSGGSLSYTLRWISRLVQKFGDSTLVDQEESVLYTIIDSISSECGLDIPATGGSVTEADSNGITWSGVMLPALRLIKTLLTTLGPTHTQLCQQTFNFLYTHSDALLTEENALGSSLVTYLSRMDWSNATLPSKVAGAGWLVQWLAGETSLVALFIHVLRAYAVNNAQNMDEYSNLQREVMHSRIVRHVVNLLSTVVAHVPHPLSTQSSSCPNSQAGFEHLVCKTQQIWLVRHLMNVCVASLGACDTPFLTVNNPRSLFSVLEISSRTACDDHSTVRCGLSLVLQVLTWSYNELTHWEQIASSLANLNVFEARLRSEGLSTPSKAREVGVDSRLYGQPVAQLLLPDALGQDLSTDELRQACQLIFNCPSRLLGSSDVVLGIDGHHREVVLLRRFLSIGLCLIRIQLRSLIAIAAQSAYIAWRYLTYYLSPNDQMLETPAPEISSPVSVLHRKQSSLRRLQDSPYSRNVRIQPETPKLNQTNLSSDGSSFKKEAAALKEQLPHILIADLFECMTRLSKAAYLESNQRLFLQVMQRRLERFATRPDARLAA